MHQPSSRVRLWLVAGVAGLTASSGVAAQIDGALRRERLTVGGLERTFLVRAPAKNDGATSPGLVVLLHGHGGSGAQLLGEGKRRQTPYSQWIPIADGAGLVLAAPDGVMSPDRRTGWNDCRTDTTVLPATDDVGFIEAMIEQLVRRYSVDRRRVYAVGTSNGGFMALRLAVERPRLVAGVGIVVAAMPATSKCREPTEPVPVVFLNGTADPLVPFLGGTVGGRRGNRGSVLSALASVELWGRLAGAAGPPTVERLPDGSTRDGSTVSRHSYLRQGRAVAVLYRVENGGHTEPSKVARHPRPLARVLGGQNADIETAEEIWRFLAGGQPKAP